MPSLPAGRLVPSNAAPTVANETIWPKFVMLALLPGYMASAPLDVITPVARLM